METKDHLSKTRRSWNMSQVRSKNTGPEKRVRALLHRLGFRFRLHIKTLPGNPDIVLKRYRTVVFVHGCFWHRHACCKKSSIPTHRQAFWLTKLNANVARDQKHGDALNVLGWHVIVVWECETRNPEKLANALRKQLLD